MVTVNACAAGHSFPDATGVAFALGLGPPSLLAAIFFSLSLFEKKYFEMTAFPLTNGTSMERHFRNMCGMAGINTSID